MNILLTGSAGSVGSAVLLDLLAKSYKVTSIDINPLPANVTAQIKADDNYTHHIVDLTHFDKLDELFASHGPFDGVIHLSALPSPLYHDPRVVHNINVVATYNVIKTAADNGVKRIVQASSVNAPGLSYTPEGRQTFDELPLREDAAMRTMDPYALSKHINELQAENLVRIDPTLRIASLRFHMVVPTYEEGVPRSRWQDLFSWVSHQACADACLLGLTSEGWNGAETFNIVAPEICWEGGISEAIPGRGELKGKVGAVELVNKAWAGRVGMIHEEYWAENPRRGLWVTEKAEKMLGWKHE